MKIFNRFICMAAIAAASLSCGSLKDEPVVLDITGEWKLESAGLLDGSLVVKSGGEVEITVYAAFGQDGKFELYQKLGEGDFVKYEVTANILTGLYDGKPSAPWGNSYEVSVEENGNVLVLTENSAGIPDRCTYVRTEIPASVRFPF